MSTDSDWEQWGKKDPYFGVLTNKKYKLNQLTEDAKAEFFKTGEEHLNYVIKVCKQQFTLDFLPKKAVDFGCGVGRILVPLSEIADIVVGLDVSESMLNEARKNCKKYAQKNNVSFIKSDDNLSLLEGKFNFIHSFIVFQHIPPFRGTRIFLKLMNYLDRGGIAAVHLVYSKTKFNRNLGIPSVPVALNLFKSAYQNLKSILTRAGTNISPPMQMNVYDLNQIFFISQSSQIEKMYVEFTEHDDQLGVFIFFQKSFK